MTVHDFNLLSDDEKSDFTWLSATCVSSRMENVRHAASLYHYSEEEQQAGFYIEIWYNMIDNRITSIVGFDSVNLLNPYFEATKVDWSARPHATTV